MAAPTNAIAVLTNELLKEKILKRLKNKKIQNIPDAKAQKELIHFVKSDLVTMVQKVIPKVAPAVATAAKRTDWGVYAPQMLATIQDYAIVNVPNKTKLVG